MPSSPIQLFVPTFEVEECLRQIRECLEKGWTGLGYKTVEIEEAWKRYTGLPHAHFLNSNTSGLHLALEVFKAKDGWQGGDEVISTPLTFVSTNHAILYSGLTPVFADVDEHLCLDPRSVEARITARTRAVMFVGLGGSTGRLGEVREICRRRGLRLILDAAHMSGTRLGGRHVGGDEDASVFSFQAVKNLPTADSGMICFRDAADDEVARQLTWLGINKDTYSRTTSQGSYKWMYDVEHVGWKYHGNSIMACIAIAQLPRLDEQNARRREIARRYRDRLAACSPIISFVPDADGCESATHLCIIRTAKRDAMMERLNRLGVFPGVHYRDNTRYRMYAEAHGTCPEAHRASDEVISLPLHMRLSSDDVDRVSDAIVSSLQSLSGSVTDGGAVV